jgi:hypothetical protein
MTTAKEKAKQEENKKIILEQLQKNKASTTPPIVQEVAKNEPPKKIGRRSHILENVEYERLGVKVPADLKNEMLVAMRTTHREYKTMDLFVAEAMRVFLSLKR